MTEPQAKSNGVMLKVVNILLLKNPERTVLGVLVGIVFSFLSKLFSPAMREIKSVDLTVAPEIGWLAIGIVLLNLPTIFSNMIRPPKINEQIDSLTKLIEQGNFSDAEKRKMYRDLVGKVLANVTMKGTFSTDFVKVKKEFLSEESID
jgi:hypothetical protein